MRLSSRSSFGLFLVLLLVVSGHPVDLAVPAPSFSSTELLPKATCTRPGNAEFYGFGIRLGIYLQILSTIIIMAVSDSNSEMIYDLHDGNAALLLAILIALVKNTPSKSVELADVVILLRLMWLIIICGFSIGHIAAEFRAARSSGKLIAILTAPTAAVFRWTVVGMVSAYNVWFWFRGVTYLRKDDQCQTYAFFFAELDIEGGLRSLYRVTSVLLVLCPPGWLLAYLGFLAGVLVLVMGMVLAFYALIPILLPISIALRIYDICHTTGASIEPARKEPEKRGAFWLRLISITWQLYGPSLQEILLTWTKVREGAAGNKSRPMSTKARTSKSEKVSNLWITYIGLVTFYYFFSILGIELSIYWNKISRPYQLDATGQLIPFVIGILSFIKVIGRACAEAERFIYPRFRKAVNKWSFYLETRRTEPSKQVRCASTPELSSEKFQPESRPRRCNSLPDVGRADDMGPDSAQERDKINAYLKGHYTSDHESSEVEGVFQGLRGGRRKQLIALPLVRQGPEAGSEQETV
ncbi:hypothetical protein PV05_02227 [Exophiala xenobiotica]|uniref:Uncharacterized protein n=1 Tax=Exophiala xenobiotica TaxID=348802 RepID=A0A0D2BYZ3_9EURO|nr:uncharacterized protein PV05_02227 [Exophiala xenobiotica]KIW57661.1 hypothetical protein PV05_02227 [Exophiala xenobiotica]